MESVTGAIAFWILAVAIIGCAVLVLTVPNIFHSALFLVGCLGGIAGIYILLNADFLAAVQILIYIGAVAVMLIFGIMLTQDVVKSNVSNHYRIPALGLSGAFLVILLTAIFGTNWQTQSPSTGASTGSIADALFSNYILPFELSSVVLLTAIIGAIVIAKER